MNYYKTATEIFLSNFFQNVFNFMGEVAPYDEPEPNQIGSFFGSTPHSLFGAALALAFPWALASELAQPHKTQEEALLVMNGRIVIQFSSRKKWLRLGDRGIGATREFQTGPQQVVWEALSNGPVI